MDGVGLGDVLHPKNGRIAYRQVENRDPIFPGLNVNVADVVKVLTSMKVSGVKICGLQLSVSCMDFSKQGVYELVSVEPEGGHFSFLLRYFK